MARIDAINPERAGPRAPRVRKRQSRRTRRGRASRRKPPAPTVSARPHIIVLGKSPLSSRVARAIRALGVQCRKLGEPTEAKQAVDGQSKALLIIPPIPSFSVSRFATRLTADFPALPVFVVMEGALPERTTRTLYKSGVEAVFEWPSETRAVKRTMLRLAAPDTVRWGPRKTPSEVALEEMVRAHLEAEAAPFGAQLRVEATDRFILLKGALDALWQLELARQIVGDIPGVEDVIAEGVEISGQGRADRSVAKAIRQVLDHAASVDRSTLAVAVRAGEVTLTGSVRDKREAQRALELVRQVRGVRRIDDYLVISSSSKRKDKALADRIQRAIDTRHPKLPIQLSVFGSVAVLAGRVPSASVRDRVKELVARQGGVERIVDKTHVSPRRSRR